MRNEYASALRKPSTLRKNVHKLVFIYPMIFSNNLLEFSNTLRDFLSISMLKQLFVDNVLKLIDVAELTERPQPANTPLPGYGLGQGWGMFHMHSLNFPNSGDVEGKLKEKIDYLKKVLETDPLLKKYRPTIEIVTLQNNLIDVPIITGTQVFPIDTAILAVFLLVAIGRNIPLTSVANLERIVNEVRNLTPQSLDSIIRNLETAASNTDEQHRRSFFSTLKVLFSGVLSKLNPFSRSTPAKRRESEFAEYYKLMEHIKDKIKDVETMFKLVLDPKLQFSLFGFENPENMTFTVRKVISPQVEGYFQQFKSELLDSLSQFYIIEIIRSAVFPLTSKESDLDINSLIDQFINYDLIDSIDKWLRKEFWLNLKSTLENVQLKIDDEGQVSGTDENFIKAFKKLCSSPIDILENDRFKQIINDAIIPNVLSSQIVDLNSLTEFLKAIDSFETFVNKLNKKFEGIISTLLPHFDETFTPLISILVDVINSFFDYIRKDSKANEQLRELGFDLNAINKYQKEMARVLINIFRLLIYDKLIKLLCSVIQVYDAELEVRKTEATELPNFALVFPVELAIAIHSIMVAKNWREYLNQRVPSDYVLNLNSNYIKGMVKFLNKRLQIPNLIVVDKNKKQIYYQFMFMNKVNNTSLSAIETFIKANKEVTQQPRISNIF